MAPESAVEVVAAWMRTALVLDVLVAAEAVEEDVVRTWAEAEAPEAAEAVAEFPSPRTLDRPAVPEVAEDVVEAVVVCGAAVADAPEIAEAVLDAPVRA